MLYGAYSFSEEPFSNGGVSYIEEVSGSEAVTSINSVAVAASAVVDVTGVEAQTFINNDDIVIRISSLVIPTGSEATITVGNLNIWSFETGNTNSGYGSVNPLQNVPYKEIQPLPAKTWDDLVI